MPSQRNKARDAEMARIRRAKKNGVVIPPSHDWGNGRLVRKPKIDLTGDRFGNLVVLRYAISNRIDRGKARYKPVTLSGWLCRCDCGVEKVFLAWDLKSGNTKSCGCLSNRLSKEDREEVVRRYVAGESSIQLAEHFPIGFGSILELVKRRGHPIREQHYNRKPVNHDYFEKIDCERKAYWVGFLLADGCVTNGGVALRLAIKDQYHVEQFKADLESDHAVTIVPGRVQKPMKGTGQIVCGGPSAHFSVKSDKMVADLQRVGIVERKSLTAVPPVLRDDLQGHFWRGVIDGDGSIRHMLGETVRLVGSKAVCEGFAEWVRRTTGGPTAVRQHGSVWQVTTWRREKLCQLLRALHYHDCEVCLARKQLRANYLFNWKRLKPSFRKCRLSPCLNQHDAFGLCQRHRRQFLKAGIPFPSPDEIAHRRYELRNYDV